MPFCMECGGNYPDKAKFCPHCGEPISLLLNKKYDKNLNPININKALDSNTNRTSNDDKLLQTSTPTLNESYGLNIQNLPVGTKLDNGKYTIQKKLGAGAFGIVYLASDVSLNGKLKALKVISNEYYSDRLTMAKLKDEARKMIGIKHKNVVRFYTVHLEGDVKFLDMEYVDGGDLVGMMLNYDNFMIPEEKVWKLANQIAEGMKAIHDNNLLHLDLKLENILLTSKEEVILTDLAIPAIFKSSKSRVQEAAVKIYDSPEQILGNNVGKEADVWSYGTILYHILTGEPLFSGATSGDILTQVDNKDFEPIDGGSDKINSFLAKCLERDYLQRFRNFEEVLAFIDGDYSQIKNGPKLTNNQVIQKFINKQLSQSSTKKSKVEEVQEMVFVKGGTFQMGSNNGEDYERPVHSVTVSDFYICKNQVTQTEYRKVLGNNPSDFNGGNYPVDNVSWYDAVNFCNKKSKQENLMPCYKVNFWNRKSVTFDLSANGYRLPTEAEWEYASRGGNKSKGYNYSGSNDLDEVAWYSDNAAEKTQPVGLKKGNEIGLYGMGGNVEEWCNDWYSSNYYTISAKSNPTGPNYGSYRVLRGGSWYCRAAGCRVSNRSGNAPSGSYSDIGFRIVRNSK